MDYHPSLLLKKERAVHNHKVIASTCWFLLVPIGIFFVCFSFYSSRNFCARNSQLLDLPSSDVHPHVLRSDKDEKGLCDLSSGRWVRDARGPVYTNRSCETIPDKKNCGKYGREDDEFLQWRWKPNGCDLARFDAWEFLGLVRGKKLAFVGDSLARNQMESLLCLLSSVETPRDVYKDKDDRFRTWHFPVYDFTLAVRWSKFLVAADERLINGTSAGAFDLHLDRVDPNWAANITDLDYLVISGGHWFFRKLYLYHHRTHLLGCVGCDGPNTAKLDHAFPIRRAFETALQFIGQCRDCGRLRVFVRTLSPGHFEHGGWNTGGKCNRTGPVQSMEEAERAGAWELELSRVQVEAATAQGRGRGGKVLGVLDVTRAMRLRPDGHPDEHWKNEWMAGYHDCVHWCLPGPIDTWNELLLELIKRSLQPSSNALV